MTLGGKCHLLKAFFLEYKLTEVPISESFGEFFSSCFKETSQNILEEQVCLGSWFAFSFRLIFRIAMKSSSTFQITA